MQCLSNLENSGIIQDPTGSHSILDKILYNLFFFQSREYGILEKILNDSRSFGILIKSEEDPAGQQIRSYAILQYPTGLLWNRNQFQKISYSILEIPIRSYKILWDGCGILDKHGRTPKHSKVLKSGIIQFPTGSHEILEESYKIVVNFSQDTMGSYTRL